MADYALTKLRRVGDADMYEVRLPDGASNRFIYTSVQRVVDESAADFQQWVAWAVRRAQRESDYLNGVR